ncbi:MAG: M23 family metallopeptidase [Clostridia bacterium]|nr:M23 family metallopeptidase [Clostridia bacterium]
MQTPQDKKSFSQRLKDLKISRSGILTALLLLVTLTIIISVTVATNRSKAPVTEDTTTRKPSTTTRPTESQTTTEPPREETTTPPAGTGSTSVENKLPSLILPVSGVLSQKHDPALQVFSTTMKDYRVHIGLDIGTEADAPVYAAADGTVSKIWEDVRMGQCIAIRHTGGCVTYYKNLSETLPDGIAEGVSVRSGQLIATVGETAMVEVAEEPHLHFEMTVNELAVDPLEYFDEKALESLSIDASHGE